ncbi:MAG: response regulator [Limisphaerales bacterium]
MRLPEVLPFHEVVIKESRPPKYQSTINPAKLLQAARQHLAAENPEAYKVLLLACGAGFRKGEIDALECGHFGFDKGLVVVESTEFHDLKTEESEAAVEVDPVLAKELKRLLPAASRFYVVADTSHEAAFNVNSEHFVFPERRAARAGMRLRAGRVRRSGLAANSSPILRAPTQASGKSFALGARGPDVRFIAAMGISSKADESGCAAARLCYKARPALQPNPTFTDAVAWINRRPAPSPFPPSSVVAPSLPTPPAPGVKKPVARVLVVEDDTDIGDLMRLALSRSLIDATLVTSGEEALTRLATESHDLILLDIALPGMSGLELCRRLKADPRHKNVPIIFVSGYHSAENKQEAERLGAVDFIEKPITLLRFLSCIMGHLKLKTNGERELRQLWPVAAVQAPAGAMTT